MVLAKISIPKEENVVSREKYVLNGIFPIGFKESNVKGSFLFLFGAYQDWNEKVIYLQFLFQTEDPFEYEALKNHNNYIPNYEDSIEKKSVYVKMIEHMTDSNLYATDFILNKSSKDYYYEMVAIRAIDEKHADVLNIYVPRQNYVKIKAFMENLNSRATVFNTSLFADKRLSKIEYVKIEQLKRDETAVVGDGTKFVDTHYTMNCGPSTYKMNYRSNIKKDGTLTNPLDSDIYSATYSCDFYIEYIIQDDDEILVIFDEDADVFGNSTEGRGTKALRLNKELADKTNFVNQYNKIYQEETTE